jgi:hypothetical protein
MRPTSSPPMTVCARLDCAANKELKRRRFLATALTAAAILTLPGCETPTFDSDRTTLTFRRRSGRSGGNDRK